MLIFNDARGFDLPLARIFARHLSTSLAWAKPSAQVALLVVKYPKRKHGETMRTCFCLKKKIPQWYLFHYLFHISTFYILSYLEVKVLPPPLVWE